MYIIMKSSIVRKITKKMNHWPNKILYWLLLGDPEVIENLYCDFAYLYWKGCSLQYIFPVTSGSPRISLDTARMTGDCSFSVPVQLDSALPVLPCLHAISQLIGKTPTMQQKNPGEMCTQISKSLHKKSAKNLGQKCAR